MLDTELLVCAVFLNAGADPAKLAQWLRANVAEIARCTDSTRPLDFSERPTPIDRG